MPRRRKRGEGSVFYDATNGVWVARVSLGMRNGKRVGKKVVAHSKREAEQERERLLRAFSQGGDPATMTLDAYLGDWLRTVQPSIAPGTFDSYSNHVRLHISPLLGGIIVAKLRPDDVRRLVRDRIAAGKAPATVGLIVTTLRMALRQAVDDRSIPDNPAVGVRLPKVKREPVAALSEVSADAILDATNGTWLRAMVALLNGSGMRRGEAIGLDWGDVHLDDAFVVVRVSKTTVRAVPISEDAVDALRRHKAAAKREGANEPVFVGPRTGERLRGDSVTHALPRFLERAGLPRMTPHGLRHGTASRMVAKGVHMRVVAEQLGHKNPAMTAKVYAHVLPESQRDAVNLLNRTRRQG